MSESFDNMGGLSCAEAASLLENRFAEEPLSNQAAKELQAHLATCGECNRLVDWMSSLPARAEAHAERRFNTGLPTAYRALANKRAKAHRRERRLKIATAAAAAAVLVGLLFSRDWSILLSSSAPDENVTADASLDCRPVPPGEPAPGILMTHCEGEALEARVGNDGEVRVRLAGGTVGLLVDPNRPNKRDVIVETPHGEVRVKGTLFTVHVDAERSRLEVFRGVVEFAPSASAEDGLSVSARHGADLRYPKVFELSSPQTDAMRQVLLETAGRQPTGGSAGSISTSEETAVALESEESAAAGPASDVDTSSVTSSAGPRGGGAAPAKQRGVPTIDRLIKEAHACLIARDWSCASSRYQELLSQYPNRPESTAALVSLARIELGHLGRPGPALAHFQAYRQKAPDGPMAEEALFGIASTYRRLGKEGPERETLRRFIEQFPQSSQIRRARARLLQLDE